MANIILLQGRYGSDYSDLSERYRLHVETFDRKVARQCPEMLQLLDAAASAASDDPSGVRTPAWQRLIANMRTRLSIR